MNDIFRSEHKYLIPTLQRYSLSHALARVISEDLHNEGDGYLVRSLYFDSLDNRDFQEKEDGVFLRRKIRLRCYGPSSNFAILEMKQKEGALQRKRSLRLSREDASSLIHGNCGILLQCSEPFAAECYTVMQCHAYLPKSIVEYRRKAFIAKENRIRITFDHHITGTESCFDIFSPCLLQNPILHPDLTVLEVKYDGFLPSYIKDLLTDCSRSELSVSKYCLSRSVSQHYAF